MSLGAIFVGVVLFALLLFGVFYWWEGVKEKAHSRRASRTREANKGGSASTGADYRLVWFEGDYGRGYQVERVSDGQKLRWQTLPRSEGLEAIGVAGESHHEDDLQSPSLEPGKPLSLVREPDNPYDENAVAIYDAAERHQAGYIPGDESVRIAGKLDGGERLQAYSMWEVWKGGKRVSLRILLVGEEASVDLP